MVWLHGGGFAAGSGGAAMYDGGALARRGDVVTVTVNHRLNVFGYLHLGELGGHPSSGQAGMLDIVLVLEWVRDNIAAFGGDPANVTIFGESGGGAKVSMLQAMPAPTACSTRRSSRAAPACARRAGSGHGKRRTTLLVALGIKPRRPPPRLEGPFGRADRRPRHRGAATRAGFSPGRRRSALPRDPFHPDAPAISADVPVLIGTNKDESTLFIRGHPNFGEFTEEDLDKRAHDAVGDKAPALVAALRRLFPDYSPTHLIAAVQTAHGMWGGSVTLAERKAARRPRSICTC